MLITVLSDKAMDELKGMTQHKARAALSMPNPIALMIN